MKKNIIGVYNGTDFVQAIPYVYNGTNWIRVIPKVYQARWIDIGGAGVLFFSMLDSSGKNIVDANGDNFLVRN